MKITTVSFTRKLVLFRYMRSGENMLVELSLIINMYIVFKPKIQFLYLVFTLRRKKHDDMEFDRGN